MLSAEEINDLVKAIAERAPDLGLIWEITPCSVVGNVNATEVLVLADGDTAPIAATILVGTPVAQIIQDSSPLARQTRGWLITTPGGGNYFVSWTSGRIATSIETTNSASSAAEQVIGTVSAYLVGLKTYRVIYTTRVGTTVANDTTAVILRVGDISGALFQVNFQQQLAGSGGAGNTIAPTIGEYRPVTSGLYTFVATLQRQGGTGSHSRVASSDAPSIFSVEYAYG